MSDSGRIWGNSRSDANAMTCVSNMYYLIREAVNDKYEDTDIRFIVGDGTITAQIETDWVGEGFGEGRCSAGNRACALIRAKEDHSYKSVFHCGCRPESQEHSRYPHAQSFDDILNLVECILRSEFDDVADPYL